MKPTFTLHSPETGTDYVVYVEQPEASAAPRPWPVMLFMDGDDQFSAAVEAYHQLRKTGAVGPLLLVGVGYGASYREEANKRGRDYTPTFHSDEPSSGGGDRFLEFLTRTLWPELARRYSIDNDIRGLAGHSLGSLLVLHALWQEPLFFNHALASAPSIWWDERSMLRIAAERRDRTPTLPAKLFLSVGEADTESMTGDLTLLEQQLATKPFRELEITTQRFPGRDHYNVILDAFRAGLTALFGKTDQPVRNARTAETGKVEHSHGES